MKLNKSQRQIFKVWAGSSRFTYNKCTEAGNSIIEKSWSDDKSLRSRFDRAMFQSLRNLVVTEKEQPSDVVLTENLGIKERIIHKNGIYTTPKEIRAYAVKDFTTSFNNLRSNWFGLKTKPKIEYRKKKNRVQTIGIPKEAVKIEYDVTERPYETGKKKRGRKRKKPIKDIWSEIEIYSKTFGKIISSSKKIPKIFNSPDKKFHPKHDLRLMYDGIDYWLLVPVESVPIHKTPDEEIVGIDPGLRSFITCYDVMENFEFETNTDKMKSDMGKLERIHAETGSNDSKKYLLESRRQRTRVDTWHTKMAKLVAKRYDTVILGKLNSHQLIKDKTTPKETRKRFSYLSHFKFRERLKLELSKYNRTFVLVKENRTSKTCGSCGFMKEDLGRNKIYKCDNCKYIADRDVNASRNMIFMTVIEGGPKTYQVHLKKCPGEAIQPHETGILLDFK